MMDIRRRELYLGSCCRWNENGRDPRASERGKQGEEVRRKKMRAMDGRTTSKARQLQD